MLRGTTFGLHIVAVGGNTESARESGIGVDYIKIWCFVLCALLGGVMGVLDGYHLEQPRPRYRWPDLHVLRRDLRGDWRYRAHRGTRHHGRCLHRCVRAGYDQGRVPHPRHQLLCTRPGHRPDDSARHDPQCPDRAGNFHARAARGRSAAPSAWSSSSRDAEREGCVHDANGGSTDRPASKTCCGPSRSR